MEDNKELLGWSEECLYKEVKLRLPSSIFKQIQNCEKNYESLKATLLLELKPPSNDIKYTHEFFRLSQRQNQTIQQYVKVLKEFHHKCNFDTDDPNECIIFFRKFCSSLLDSRIMRQIIAE
eukprot:NODE_222_length_12365_cov_0.759009.p6 type:complete len:121 gc:universal NODE_222_length_12365_cov_0.759009:10444-10806(+)